jgi:cytochrome c
MGSVAATARLSMIAAGAVAALGALAACGQPSSNTGNAAAANAPVGGPTELTDAQKKALVAELPAAYQGADLSNGEARFAICRSCHTLPEGGEDMTGPNLWGIFGRKAGSKPGFAYSDELKTAGWSWDADRIDKWIENPHAVLHDTKMTFVGMPSPTDRRDVIAFLKVQTSPAPK